MSDVPPIIGGRSVKLFSWQILASGLFLLGILVRKIGGILFPIGTVFCGVAAAFVLFAILRRKCVLELKDANRKPTTFRFLGTALISIFFGWIVFDALIHPKALIIHALKENVTTVIFDKAVVIIHTLPDKGDFSLYKVFSRGNFKVQTGSFIISGEHRRFGECVINVAGNKIEYRPNYSLKLFPAASPTGLLEEKDLLWSSRKVIVLEADGKTRIESGLPGIGIIRDVLKSSAR